MSRCRVCGRGALEELLDLGPQPVLNRFPADPKAPEFVHPLGLAVCKVCGQVQLRETFPSSEIRPREGKIAYWEPEEHLDDLAARLRALKCSTVCGVTFQDDSLIERMKKGGLKAAWRLDPKEDLEIDDPGAGLETIQERLTPETARRIAVRRGRADMVVAQHILEHAYDAPRFVAALRELASPKGHVVFDAPDCARSMEKNDYGLIWEEHVLYFTEGVFRRLIPSLGMALSEFISYPYPMENSMVAVARAGKAAEPSVDRNFLAGEHRRAQAYARGLPRARERLAGLLGPRAGRAAWFGAGHRSAALINFLGLKDLLAFVVDDDPNKKGLFMPGSRLPILPSSALAEKGVKLCILNVSAQSEARIMRRAGAFLEKGGEFVHAN